MSSVFESWVNSPEKCFPFLRACVRQVRRRADRSGIVLNDNYLAAENWEDYLSAVASDLWQFVKSNADAIASEATILLVSGDEDDLMAFICQKFLDDCRDKRRTSSPFHDYYRIMRTALHAASEEGTLHYVSRNRKGSYYAYSIQPNLQLLPDTLTRSDYGAWRASDVPFNSIFDNDAMLGLSRHFWDESLREFLQEYLLPIRELVKFVCTKYPVILTLDYQDATDEGDGEENTTISLENRLVDSVAASSVFNDSWKRQRPVIEADVIDTQLDTIAFDCAAEMTAKEQTILVQLDSGEILENIAAALKMKHASNVSYHQKKAYARIHTKWSLWGPSSIKMFGDVGKEEFFMFYEKVIDFCKTAETCRDSRKGLSV